MLVWLSASSGVKWGLSGPARCVCVHGCRRAWASGPDGARFVLAAEQEGHALVLKCWREEEEGRPRSEPRVETVHWVEVEAFIGASTLPSKTFGPLLGTLRHTTSLASPSVAQEGIRGPVVAQEDE